MMSKFSVLSSLASVVIPLVLSGQVLADQKTPRERKLYVGKDSSEAVMTFNHRVEVSTTKPVTEALAREKIAAQLTHLFGPMGEAAQKAVPKGNEEITHVKIAKKPGAASTYVVTYSYKGTIVLQSGSDTTYEVLLPVNPDKVYDAGVVTTASGKKHNPCTDHHYQSEGDFWYFWNPSNPGCKLKLGTDYDKVQAKITRLANTTKTFPEYARLADKNGTIRVSILMGMDDPSKKMDPYHSSDVNAPNYVGIHEALVNKYGYSSRQLSGAEIQAKSGDASVLPFVEVLTKKTPKADFEITMFFGPTGIDEESQAFHYFFKDALEHASVMMYDGHSGLGGHLDLDSIQQTEGFTLQPSKNQYQIYYFNSCSSYTYYNTLYFGRKKSASDPKGTKNLDIMTNGLATYFSVMGETDLALIQAIDNWATGKGVASYQSLAKAIDSGNLFGVNGDEDNSAR